MVLYVASRKSRKHVFPYLLREKRAIEAFHHPVGLGMVWGSSCLLNPHFLAKGLDILGLKLTSLVSVKAFRDPTPATSVTIPSDWGWYGGSSGLLNPHFLSEGVDNLSLKLTSLVSVKAFSDPTAATSVTIPSDWGWYGVVLVFLIPIFCQRVWTTWASN